MLKLYSIVCIFYVRCFFELYGDHRDLHVLTHSFPTRRSADLGLAYHQFTDRVEARLSAVVVGFDIDAETAALDFAGMDRRDRHAADEAGCDIGATAL